MVLLIRPDGNSADAAAIRSMGLQPVIDPYLEVRDCPGPDPQRLLEDLRRTGARAHPTWLLVTSPRAVGAWSRCVGAQALLTAMDQARCRGLRAACPGERTASTLRTMGFGEVTVASAGSAAGLLAELADSGPATALLPAGDQALRTLPDGLLSRGWQVRSAVVYATVPVSSRPRTADMVTSGEVAAVLLRSPSAARALLSRCRPPAWVRLVCAGDTTANAVRQLGYPVAAVSRAPGPQEVARTVAAVLGSMPPAHLQGVDS